jgi:hypothetical protein
MSGLPRVRSLLMVLLLASAAMQLHAQASALPPANPDDTDTTPDRGRKLLDEMIEALGGPAWLNRSTWVEYGQTGHFYKGKPDPYVVGFEDYFRAKPFGERVVVVTHGGALTMLGMPGRNHRDVAQLWTADDGYEITYKGKKELPRDDVAEFFHVQRHSLDVVVNDWLRRSGVSITYDGSDMVERRLAQKVTVAVPGEEPITLALDEGNHLPLSLTFRYRNETYKDFDSETVEYDDYHLIAGIMTPMTLTRLKNGDMVSQRFIKSVDYNAHIPADLFDPDAAVKAEATRVKDK